jgi:pimeloyl-ACP methyl ester carboxylesterase
MTTDTISDTLRGIDVPSEGHMIESADGTRIATFKLGSGPIAWVMPPAMGAPLLSMKRVIEPLADRVTIYTWDMRGFYASDAPRDARAYSVEHHVADLEATVRAWSPREFVLGGWSMGVQLSLERHHRSPGDVLGLVLINGPYERALAAVAPVVHPLVARSLALGPRLAPALNALSVRVLGAPKMADRLHGARFLAANPELFSQVLERFSRVDWGRYFTVTRHLHEHSAEAYLSGVRVPTLITSGTRDFMAPPSIAQRLHARIAGSELFVVERATHYIPIEFGELLAERIGSFLDRVGRRAA